MEPPLMENEYVHTECYVIQESYGFGYVHLTQTYKLVAVLFDVECDKSQVMVYTLGCTSWRRLEIDFPCLPYDYPGKFVSGTINWIGSSNWDSEARFIISLDLGKESCQELRLPDIDDRYPTLAVFRECLCVVSHERDISDIWLMEEHGNDESWTKLFRVLDHERDVGYYPNQPIYIYEGDDEVELPSFSNLVVCNHGEVFKIFDIQNSQVWMFPEIWEFDITLSSILGCRFYDMLLVHEVLEECLMHLCNGCSSQAFMF